jgi:hypothetical protein
MLRAIASKENAAPRAVAVTSRARRGTAATK